MAIIADLAGDLTKKLIDKAEVGDNSAAQTIQPVTTIDAVKPIDAATPPATTAAAEAAPTPAATIPAPERVVPRAPAATPATREIDPAKETVAGQMESLLKKDSPYLRYAREETARQANRRGLINSLMAAGAGTEAGIKAALPIAQQDAKSYLEQGMTNQAAEQKMLENQQNADLTMDVAEQRQLHDTYRMNLQGQIDQMKESHSAGLKEHLELVLADAKLSNDMKGTFAQEMGRIMTESQTQIGTVGASDRTAAQQSAAIEQIIKQRDSQIILMRDMMQQSTQWNWFGTTTLAAA
jgi:hypothetical protein